MQILDAVNYCLRYIGEMPVPSDADIGSLDELHEAVVAKNLIEEVNTDLQYRGWWFNTESWEFMPQEDKTIIIPSEILEIKSTSYLIRGSRLYDTANKTQEFTGPVNVTSIFLVPFDELPYVFQMYVIYNVAQRLNILYTAEDTIAQDLQNKLQLQMIEVERADMSRKNVNLITSSKLYDRTTNPQSGV